MHVYAGHHREEEVLRSVAAGERVHPVVAGHAVVDALGAGVVPVYVDPPVRLVGNRAEELEVRPVVGLHHAPVGRLGAYSPPVALADPALGVGAAVLGGHLRRVVAVAAHLVAGGAHGHAASVEALERVPVVVDDRARHRAPRVGVLAGEPRVPIHDRHDAEVPHVLVQVRGVGGGVVAEVRRPERRVHVEHVRRGGHRRGRVVLRGRPLRHEHRQVYAQRARVPADVVGGESQVEDALVSGSPF